MWCFLCHRTYCCNNDPHCTNVSAIIARQLHSVLAHLHNVGLCWASDCREQSDCKCNPPSWYASQVSVCDFFCRCMGARLQQMQQSALSEVTASSRARSERLVSQCCLASFLSFLTFTVNVSSSLDDGDSGKSQYRPAVDLSAALHAALLSQNLEWVIPWVAQYLRFLGHDIHAHSSGHVQQVLHQLQTLHSCTALLPQSAAFGPVALCLRSVLDAHLEQAAEVEAVEHVSDAAWLAAVHTWEETADLKHPIVDARYMQLCCPLLDHARQAVQVRSAFNAHRMAKVAIVLWWSQQPCQLVFL